jgi:beta-phosphoglucomutase
MGLRATIFDFDGTIVDSEPLHFRSLQDALERDGVRITQEEYWDHLLAYDDRSAIRIALERRGEPADAGRVSRVERVKVERFAELIPEVPVLPGARELILTLAAEMPLAIASGARREEVEAILAGVGLQDYFRTVVGAQDAAATKPDPAPYLEAARRLAALAPGLAPAECLALEDSLAGVLSARAAGMKVVGIAHTYSADRLKQATRVVDSLASLEAGSLHALFED